MRIFPTAALASAAIILAACSSDSTEPSTAPTTVTIVTHDSFSIPDEILADFEASSGLKVEFVAPGDGGSLASQLVLTKDNPLGDVAFGLDNTFASKAVKEGVFDPYTSSAPASADASQYKFDGTEGLTAIDYSDVCLNIDNTYFAARSLEAPLTLEDLLKPEYQGLLAVTNPLTSSPGLAFLLATYAEYGDGWVDYWKELVANGAYIGSSWSDVYYTLFSAPNYGGDYPIVLSYASSPPSELVDDEPTTSALLDTCFRQVEYAGVLDGAKNPEGARKVIDWFLSDDFQAALPDSMYVYPVSSLVEIPAGWAKYAPLSSSPFLLSADQIDENRDDILRTWLAEIGG